MSLALMWPMHKSLETISYQWEWSCLVARGVSSLRESQNFTIQSSPQEAKW